MKILLILTAFTFLLTGCSSNNDNENPNDSNENEYVILIPESIPLAVVEKNDGKLILAIKENSNSNIYKINQISESGIVDWETDLQTSDIIVSGSLFYVNDSIYFFYKTNNELKLITLDNSGNLISNNFSSNQAYNSLSINKSTFGFTVSNYGTNQVTTDEYTDTGELLNSHTLNFSNAQYHQSNLIKNGNKSYLFRNYNLVNSTYQDFDCNIFNDSNESINTLTINGLTKSGNIHESFPINNNLILMVTNEELGGDIGREINLTLFDESGNEIESISLNGYTPDFNISPLMNDKICFLAQKKPNQNGKKLNFKILNSNLVVEADLNIGSYDNIGTFNFTCYESGNYYYIYGITDGEDGDFELQNNSSTTDLFLFKIMK